MIESIIIIKKSVIIFTYEYMNLKMLFCMQFLKMSAIRTSFKMKTFCNYQWMYLLKYHYCLLSNMKSIIFYNIYIYFITQRILNSVIKRAAFEIYRNFDHNGRLLIRLIIQYPKL